MEKDNYQFTYFDEFGKEHLASFKTNEYHNLMELLFDKYVEEWGDCKGRAWCGTCHIQLIKGAIAEKIDADEKHTLSKMEGVTQKSRLACQIPLNSTLDGVVFKIMETS